MGSTETDKPVKDPKAPTPPPNTTQEQLSATSNGTANPEWSGYQAYSPIPPHGFVASSPQGHPYMWGVQPIMPPYGTPSHPYMAMYPHGVYAHPSIPPGSYPYSPYAVPPAHMAPEASGNTPGGTDGDGKHPEGKEKLPIKRSKGSLGSLNMITGKKNEQGKTKARMDNGAHSNSGDSASGGSSEGSDAYSQNVRDSQTKSGGGQGSLEADASQNGSSAHGSQNGMSNPPHTIVSTSVPIVPMPAAGAVAGPTTNLNIGMDYWGASAASSVMPSMQGKVPSAMTPTGIVASGSRDSLQSQPWLQDERELKKQKRKQSNRESARRSRLRKQAECDELAQRADALREENAGLRSEINRIRNEYDHLVAENKLLKERIGEASGIEEH